MGKIFVVNHISLDGVMQSPARPEEDTRGGFERGGWGVRGSDEEVAREMGQRMGGPGALLLGRWTYEEFFKVWPGRTDGNPYTEALNRAQKYVVSSTLSEPLPWQNSTLLNGDAVQAVTRLKADVDGTITVLGSQNLLQTLIRADLIDEYLLMIHPLLLGSGARLFEGGAHAELELLNSVTTSKGVVIATYKARAGAAPPQPGGAAP
jgi:dihydrofolate reductase